MRACPPPHPPLQCPRPQPRALSLPALLFPTLHPPRKVHLHRLHPLLPPPPPCPLQRAHLPPCPLPPLLPRLPAAVKLFPPRLPSLLLPRSALQPPTLAAHRRAAAIRQHPLVFLHPPPLLLSRCLPLHAPPQAPPPPQSTPVGPTRPVPPAVLPQPMAQRPLRLHFLPCTQPLPAPVPHTLRPTHSAPRPVAA